MTPAPKTPSFFRRNWPRMPLMVFALSALLAGLWAGLARLGWRMPPLSGAVLVQHGTLMVSGFLGTLISLERAVALSQLHQRKRIFYLAPLLAGLGAVALLLPVPAEIPQLLITLGAAGYLLIFLIIYRMHPVTHNIVMGLGALLWLVGAGLWLAGRPIFQIVPWWAGFLVLTIAGERLELTRVLILKQTTRTLFLGLVGVLLAGLVLSLFAFDPGMRLVGAAFAALGVWLLRFDIARHTIRKKGLTQFIAACLLPGYVWLVLGGLLWLVFGGVSPAGFIYDARLHAIFLGFVFSMIFGHAPVILPAVLGVPLQFSPIFYLHLGLLHLSLVLRISGDLLFWLPGRRWGGLLNEIAVLLFLLITILAARAPRATQGEKTRA